jgi:hypothetical protein
MTRRFLSPEIFADRNARAYRVSFQIAEEGTWGHKFHDLSGNEINPNDLWLEPDDLSVIQANCDLAVGHPLRPLTETTSENSPSPNRPRASTRRAGDRRFVPISLQGV